MNVLHGSMFSVFVVFKKKDMPRTDKLAEKHL